MISDTVHSSQSGKRGSCWRDIVRNQGYFQAWHAWENWRVIFSRECFSLKLPVMCPSQSQVRVTSPSSQSHDMVESEMGHKNCRVTSSHWFASSSQCWVIWNFTFFTKL